MPALGTDDIVLWIKLHVIGRVEIQIAVEVVVQKATTSTPPGISPTHRRGRVGKAPVHPRCATKRLGPTLVT